MPLRTHCNIDIDIWGCVRTDYYKNWCVLRREFSGIIPVITSNVIIPATPSNPSIPISGHHPGPRTDAPLQRCRSQVSGGPTAPLFIRSWSERWVGKSGWGLQRRPGRSRNQKYWVSVTIKILGGSFWSLVYWYVGLLGAHVHRKAIPRDGLLGYIRWM